MPGKLQGRVAIVTGAGGGFGEGIAKHFAELGAHVVVADIRANAAQRVAGEIESAGGTALPVTVDVTRSDAMKALVDATLARFQQIDILVNNAGTTHKNRPMLEVDEPTFDLIYATNVKSVYLGAIHVVPVMRRQGRGVIVNIASTAGVRPRPGLTWYNGSKGAVITLTKSMAAELAPDKIRVCAVNPVMGETGLIGQFLPGDDTPETRSKIIATIPLGRLSQPMDVAQAAAFLASDEAAFITGVSLEVDGGRCV